MNPQNDNKDFVPLGKAITFITLVVGIAAVSIGGFLVALFVFADDGGFNIISVTTAPIPDAPAQTETTQTILPPMPEITPIPQQQNEPYPHEPVVVVETPSPAEEYYEITGEAVATENELNNISAEWDFVNMMVDGYIELMHVFEEIGNHMALADGDMLIILTSEWDETNREIAVRGRSIAQSLRVEIYRTPNPISQHALDMRDSLSSALSLFITLTTNFEDVSRNAHRDIRIFTESLNEYTHTTREFHVAFVRFQTLVNDYFS